EGSRLELAKEAKRVYAFTLKALHTAQQHGVNLSAYNHRLGYNLPHTVLPLAHYYMERSKNTLLLAHITQAEAKLKAQLPAAVSEKERELNKQLLLLSRLLEEEHNKTAPDENKLNQWQQQYFAHKMAYDELLAQINQEYPHYSQLKQQYHIPTINHIQQAMPANMAMISYVTGKQLTFIFVVTHHNCTFTATPLEQATKDAIKNFDFLIQNDFDTEAYTQAAHHLYQCLVEPALANIQATKDVTSLLFLPDEKIAAIPFEALLSHAPAKGGKFAELPYLINRYDIGYHLSAALWYKDANAQTKQQSVMPATQLGFAGFAPVYQNTQQTKPQPLPSNAVRSVKVGNTEFDELIYSEQEVAGVEHFFRQKQQPAQAYLHLEANLSNFMQYAHRAKHLLISAHAHYNKKSPKLSAIIFSPDKPTDEQCSLLYMPDIYTLQLQNTDLLTLSCCDTGIGKQVAGEGVLGINRAFLYAGVKNIIYTLFKVYDYSSSQLSQKFYELLMQDDNAGKAYLEILSQAKRQLIQEGKIAAPKHWSGFVLVGAGRVNL
ncbi:MAG TPA: CHAT domain-containing protein, partial [Chitinophagales bacterium]|nr:CHAT domain-containing protein [Chitinophagales bacterium]